MLFLIEVRKYDLGILLNMVATFNKKFWGNSVAKIHLIPNGMKPDDNILRIIFLYLLLLYYCSSINIYELMIWYWKPNLKGYHLFLNLSYHSFLWQRCCIISYKWMRMNVLLFNLNLIQHWSIITYFRKMVWEKIA